MIKIRPPKIKMSKVSLSNIGKDIAAQTEINMRRIRAISFQSTGKQSIRSTLKGRFKRHSVLSLQSSNGNFKNDRPASNSVVSLTSSTG